jgi:hypothetical protein
MKLGSFYKDNLYIITQSPHGSNQSYQAMDFGYLGYGDKNLYAPCDMTFRRSWGVDYDGGCEYNIDNSTAYVQFVHITPTNKGRVKKGERFALAKGDHGHIAIYYNGWKRYLDYADKTAKLHWWQMGGTHATWTNWLTYADREIICYTDTEMVTLQLPIKIKTTNTAPLNVRKEPNTTSEIITKIPGPTEFETKILASGTEVNGNKNWYGVLNGYISGHYVQEIPQTADCNLIQAELDQVRAELVKTQEELKLANEKIVTYEASIEDLKKSVSDIKKAYKDLIGLLET